MGVRVHPQTACACSRAPVWDRESATRDHDREVTHGNWAPNQLTIDAHPRTSLRLVGPNMLCLACSAVDGGGVEESARGPKREAEGCGTDSDDRSTVTRPASLGPRMLYLGSRDHLLHRPACGLQPLSEPSSTQFGCERRLLACWLQPANKEPPRNTQSRFEKAAGFEDTRMRCGELGIHLTRVSAAAALAQVLPPI